MAAGHFYLHAQTSPATPSRLCKNISAQHHLSMNYEPGASYYACSGLPGGQEAFCGYNTKSNSQRVMILEGGTATEEEIQRTYQSRPINLFLDA